MSYIPLIARVDSLPPLPESVLELETLFQEEYPDIDALVAVISKDPSLTADILAKVNAPLYGFSKKIISILQAVTLFGATQIRSIVLSSSIQRSFDIDLTPYNISTSMFSKISLMQSELLFQWYMNIDIDVARSLTPMAFLMETGKILLAQDIISKDKVEEFQNDLSSYEDVAYVENIHTMMSTAQVNALIFEQLNLNDSFAESMRYLDNEKETVEEMKSTILILQIVRTAVNTQEQFSEYSLANAFALLEENNYQIDTFKRAVQRIKKKYYQ